MLEVVEEIWRGNNKERPVVVEYKRMSGVEVEVVGREVGRPIMNKMEGGHLRGDGSEVEVAPGRDLELVIQVIGVVEIPPMARRDVRARPTAAATRDWTASGRLKP